MAHYRRNYVPDFTAMSGWEYIRWIGRVQAWKRWRILESDGLRCAPPILRELKSSLTPFHTSRITVDSRIMVHLQVESTPVYQLNRV